MASREQTYSAFKLPPEQPPSLPPKNGGPPPIIGRPPVQAPPPVFGQPPAGRPPAPAPPPARAPMPPPSMEQPLYDDANLDLPTNNNHAYNLGVGTMPQYNLTRATKQANDLYLETEAPPDQYFEPAITNIGYPASYDMRGQIPGSRVLIPPSKGRQPAVVAGNDDTYLDLEGVGTAGLQRQPSTKNTTVLNVKDPLQAQTWFYPDITRQDAEEMLRNEPPGSFVVRPGKRPGLYVLSVKIDEGATDFSHMEIAPKYSQSSTGGTRTVFILGGFSEPHSSVVSLIEYHHRTPIEIIGKVNICLQDPIPFS